MKIQVIQKKKDLEKPNKYAQILQSWKVYLHNKIKNWNVLFADNSNKDFGKRKSTNWICHI